jgi:hypothetical protein
MTLVSIYIRTLKYSNSRIRDERMISLAYGYATLPVQQYSLGAWVRRPHMLI